MVLPAGGFGGEALSVFVGGVVGAGSTLLLDSVRWRRDRTDRRDETRRQIYGQYLMALTTTGRNLQAVAVGTPVGRETVMAAFRENSLLTIRYQVDLVAPRGVTEASDHAYGCLRNIREAIATTELSIGPPAS